MSVYVLNRGQNARQRSLPADVTWLQADIGDAGSVRKALGDLEFGAVANFLSFSAADVAGAVGIFRGRTRQYLHISTASLYRKPLLQWPIVESNLRRNPYVAYSREKIAAEDELMRACVDTGFPVTIVRPSHTYDEASPPLPGDWTVVDRIARGAEVIVPGDGTSLWTLTTPTTSPRAWWACSATPVPSARSSTSPRTTSTPGTRSTRSPAVPWGRSREQCRPAAGLEAIMDRLVGATARPGRSSPPWEPPPSPLARDAG